MANQVANRANDDRSPDFVDAKPETLSVTLELSDQLDGAEDRPIPAPELKSSISGWVGDPKDRGN
ncbi:TPA: hypothetical protein DEP94_00235 [Candidatus Nomurabacteria bacterium]|nr:hypothetical protein [Candidatus Nomurabacteria bacterium]